VVVPSDEKVFCWLVCTFLVFKCYGWLEGDASEPGGKDAEGRRVSVAVGTFGMSGLGSRKGRGGR
jgi:hypothetical protein